jgi:hypothetical protein
VRREKAGGVGPLERVCAYAVPALVWLGLLEGTALSSPRLPMVAAGFSPFLPLFFLIGFLH